MVCAGKLRWADGNPTEGSGSPEDERRGANSVWEGAEVKWELHPDREKQAHYVREVPARRWKCATLETLLF